MLNFLSPVYNLNVIDRTGQSNNNLLNNLTDIFTAPSIRVTHVAIYDNNELIWGNIPN
jgi:hypothetical protein